nr:MULTISPECIES: DMT family transporter [unclassified Mesorhizobium]
MIYITAALLLAPKLGAASFIVAVIAGQMAASTAIDHFALMSFAHWPITTVRFAGLVLIIAGLVVTQWSNSIARPSAQLDLNSTEKGNGK